MLSFNVAAAAALVPSIAKDFALSQLFTGKIIWMYMLPYGLAALLYGPLVRIFDAKKIELICMFLFSCANLLAALAPNIYVLFVARFLMGFFGASVIPLALILIARDIEPNARGKQVGIFFSATFAASLAGLALSGVLAWRLIFLIPSIFGFLLFIHIWMYLPQFPPRKADGRVNYLEACKNATVIRIFAYIFFISLFYHGLQQWLAVYFSVSYGLRQSIISTLIMLTSLSGVFGEVLGGWFSDSLGRIKTVNLGIAAMIICALLLVVKMPLWVLAALMFSWGFGWTLNHAGVSTILTDLPEKFVNEAASLNSSVRFIAGGLGVAVAGALISKGFHVNFIVFGMGLVVLLLMGKKLLTVR